MKKLPLISVLFMSCNADKVKPNADAVFIRGVRILSNEIRIYYDSINQISKTDSLFSKNFITRQKK